MMLAFRDVVVSPFTGLLDAPTGGSPHQGGPDWPDWDDQHVARHIRGDRPIDDRPSPVEPVETIHEEVAWAGPFVAPFGHQVAEFSMRIVPTLLAAPDITLLVAAKPAIYPSAESVPGWTWDVCRWLGAPRTRIRFVDRPVLCRRLLVAPQAEPFGARPSSDHLDQMDRLVAERLGPAVRSGTLYVSRSGLRGRLAGESILENALSACGVGILRPEAHTVEEQLRAYSTAERLIFAEGSAVHAVQLLGRSLGDVHVIVRRPRDRIARQTLESRGIGHRYHESAALLHGFLHNGFAATARGIPVMNPGRLVASLGPVVPGLADALDIAAFRSSVIDDVREWMETIDPTPPGGPPVGLVTVEGSRRIGFAEALAIAGSDAY